MFPSHIKISQLICSAHQLTGFYMMVALVVTGLILETKFEHEPLDDEIMILL